MPDIHWSLSDRNPSMYASPTPYPALPGMHSSPNLSNCPTLPALLLLPSALRSNLTCKSHKPNWSPSPQLLDSASTLLRSLSNPGPHIRPVPSQTADDHAPQSASA